MNQGKSIPAVFFALVCLPLAAFSDDDTTLVFRADGHALLAECGDIVSFLETGVSNDSRVGGSYCLGMVNGMLNLNTIYQARDQHSALLCPPRDRTITNAEAVGVVVNYLRDNPDRLDLDQASLMFYAFEASWPCQ